MELLMLDQMKEWITQTKEMISEHLYAEDINAPSSLSMDDIVIHHLQSFYPIGILMKKANYSSIAPMRVFCIE